MTESMPKLNSLPELTKEQRSYIATGYLMCVKEFMLDPHNNPEQSTKLFSATAAVVERYLPLDIHSVIKTMICESNDRPTYIIMNHLCAIINSLQTYDANRSKGV